MTILFISSSFSDIKHKMEKNENSLAFVEKVDEAVPASWKERVFDISDIEREMFEKDEGASNLDKEIIEWIKAWPNKPVLNGKSFKELLEYKGTSLWWFGETNMFRTSFGNHVVSLKETVIRLETLKYGIKKYEPSQLYLDKSNNLTSKCSLAVCNAMNIPITFLRHKKENSSPNEINFIMARRLKQMRHFLRCIIAKANKNQFSSSSNDSSPVMIFSLQRFIESIDLKKNIVGLPKDSRFYTLFEVLEERYGRLPRVMYADSHYPIGLSTVRNLKAPAFPLEFYSSIFDSEQSNMQRKLRRTWKKLVKSDAFKKSLNYKGIQLWPLLQDNFSLLFIKQFPEAIECLKTMENALANEKPEVIIIINETGFYGRALLLASQNQGVKSIGLQHGGIAYFEIEYYHKGEGENLKCPISDIIAVTGIKDKERLLEYGLYNDDNVIVTGSPKYDLLYQSKESYSRDELIKRLGIKQDRIVVVITQPFPIVSEREQWLRAIMSASKEITDTFFIIKPHPGELNVDMHKKMCEDLKLDNAIVADRLSDTNELMYAADLMVSAGSGAGLESLMLGTPLLVVLLSGRETVISSLEYGTAIGVYKKDEILPAMRKMLQEDISLEIKNNMDEYIHNYAFKIDGKASERVLKIVENIIIDDS